MSGHTKEPWEAFTECPGQCCWLIRTAYDEDGDSELITSPETGEENARRIVACVNACVGIDTVQVEMLNVASALESLNAVRQERDALLAALTKARSFVSAWPQCRDSLTPHIRGAGLLEEIDSSLQHVPMTLSQVSILREQRDELLAELKECAALLTILGELSQRDEIEAFLDRFILAASYVKKTLNPLIAKVEAP